MEMEIGLEFISYHQLDMVKIYLLALVQTTLTGRQYHIFHCHIYAIYFSQIILYRPRTNYIIIVYRVISNYIYKFLA